MALFIDGGMTTLEDLTSIDSQVLDVASVEGIDVTRKLEVAQTELKIELGGLLARVRSVDIGFWPSGLPDVDSVVLTPALQQWHVYRTLEMFYSDAYFSQLNDRYKAKRDQFAVRAKWAREKVLEAGLGIAACPVPRAMTPELTEGGRGTLAEGTYYVTVAWMNANGEEGACATAGAITTHSSSIVVATKNPPPTAMGWNVYIGTAPERMTLQNTRMIEGDTIWRQATPLKTDSWGPGDGQTPSYMQSIPNLIQRG